MLDNDVWEWKLRGVGAPRARPLRGSGAAAARAVATALGAQVARSPGQDMRAPATWGLHGVAANRRELPLALSGKSKFRLIWSDKKRHCGALYESYPVLN